MWNLPNKITLTRLLLALVFFVLVTFEQTKTLDWALAIYIVACATDYFDGYFARKLNLITSFGRIADPFVDKVIVCGGFALMASRQHADHVSPVMPWMVVVLICREFLVSGIRDESESKGIEFGAEFTGKLKAAFQMVALGFAIHLYTHGDIPFFGAEWGKWITEALIYIALALTVLSALTYILKAVRLMGRKV